MHVLRYWVIASTAILGLALGSWGLWESSNTRWSPVFERPIPKPTAGEKLPFWSDSGAFEIEVKAPMSASELAETGGLTNKPPLSCRLSLAVRSSGHVISNVELTSLRWTGIVGSTHMNCFSGGTINIPKLGMYVLQLTNAGSQLETSPANFSLVRRENAANALVLVGVSKVLCCVMLATCCTAWFLPWILRRLKAIRR